MTTFVFSQKYTFIYRTCLAQTWNIVGRPKPEAYIVHGMGQGTENKRIAITRLITKGKYSTKL